MPHRLIYPITKYSKGQHKMKSILACSLLTLSVLSITTVHAESAFQGFYGQLSTGYESNTLSGINPSWRNMTNNTTTGTGGQAAKRY